MPSSFFVVVVVVRPENFALSSFQTDVDFVVYVLALALHVVVMVHVAVSVVRVHPVAIGPRLPF
jgi:hypothetical protein